MFADGLRRVLFAFAALAVVSSAFVFAVFAGEESDGVDWLRAKNGREVFAKGFATADPLRAKDFVATGIAPKTITLNGYAVVLRSGIYYSDEENPDESRDIPASAEILKNGARWFAAKGYKFTNAREENGAIVVRHWQGKMGCALTDYHLRPAPAGLTLTKTETLNTRDNSPCQTQ